MSDPRRARWSGEPSAERLLALVRDACAGERGLPARLAAGLRVALDLLAAEPQLAYELTVAPGPDPDAERAWLVPFGELLREAAASDPRATVLPLSWLSTFLVGGVRFRIAGIVMKGEAADLPRLLPSLLESLLSYYFEPGEPRDLARAALAG